MLLTRARLHDVINQEDELAAANGEADGSGSTSPDEDTDADVGVASVSAGTKKFANLDRPNYFVCLRCTTKKIRTQAADVQSAIVAYDGRLQESCISIPCLHITLITLRLDSDDSKEVWRFPLNVLTCSTGCKSCTCFLSPADAKVLE